MGTSSYDPSKWNTSDWITAIGSGMQGIFGGGGSERELTDEELDLLKAKLNRGGISFHQMYGLEKEMKAPVDMGQISMMSPMVSRAITPQVKKMMTTMGSRFGVRSPITTGAVGNMAASTLAQSMSGLYSSAVRDKWSKLGQIYGARANLARV